MTNEQWIYEAVRSGELELDAEGKVWRVGMRCGAGPGRSVVIPVERRRAEHPHPRGYLFLSRKSHGKKRQCLAHRLVWLHVHGPVPDGLTINHIDGVKDNNRPENLELATHGEQALHALHVIHTRVPTAGERSWTAKLNEAQVSDIRQRYGLGEKQKALANDYNVHPSTISNIVHAVTWGGEDIARTKGLTPAQKVAIRAGLMAGQTGAELARQYGVSPATISRFRHRRD